MTFLHWLMTSRWREKSDIFYIINTPEIFYYHFITLMSSLNTLVDVTWRHVSGYQNCSGTPVSLLLLYPYLRKKGWPALASSTTPVAWLTLWLHQHFVDVQPGNIHRRHIADTFLAIPEHVVFVPGKPFFQINVLDAYSTIVSFTGTKSWLLFHLLGQDRAWPRLPA